MIQNYGLVGLGVTVWGRATQAYPRVRSDQPSKTWDADYRGRMRMTPIAFQPSTRRPDRE